MDDIDFLRGIEGEQQNGQDLVSGAEHFIRLKKQVGMSRSSDPDLELNKEAGIKDVIEGARSGLKYQAMGAGAGARGLKIPGSRSRSVGMLAGMAAPAIAAGGVGYLAGRAHNKDKTAGYEAAKNSLKELMKTNPMARSAVIGGAATGAVNAIRGAADSPGNRIGGAIRGGVDGAAIGAAGGALYHHLNNKLAEAREKTANAIVDRLKDVNPALLASTGIGALAGGIGTYLASRPQSDTGKSRAEEELEGKVEAQKNVPERGLLTKMHHRNTEMQHGLAKAFKDHPNKAALLGATTGALGGYGIGRLAGGLSKLRGGV